jgi:hypothetical protein
MRPEQEADPLIYYKRESAPNFLYLPKNMKFGVQTWTLKALAFSKEGCGPGDKATRQQKL